MSGIVNLPTPSNQQTVMVAQSGSWSETRTNYAKFSHTWTIGDFTRTCRDAETAKTFFDSSVFPTVSKDNIKWRMELYPTGNLEENKDHLSLFLYLVSSDVEEVRAYFSFSILNANGEKMNVKSLEKSHVFTKAKNNWGWPKFARTDFVLHRPNGLIPNDKLTLFCEVEMKLDPVTITGEKYDVTVIKVSDGHELSQELSRTLTFK